MSRTAAELVVPLRSPTKSETGITSLLPSIHLSPGLWLAPPPLFSKPWVSSFCEKRKFVTSPLLPSVYTGECWRMIRESIALLLEGEEEGEEDS